jgi:Lrp/AsnC family transcriptional regulator for asnA, asnC and gidA
MGRNMMEDENGSLRERKKRNIDSLDSKLITLLQGDGRLTNTDIAKKLNIAESTVRARLKRLMDEGFIQIVAVSDPYKLGFDMTGDLFIQAEISKIEGVIQELKKLRELWFIVTTSGRMNINAEFIVKTREELNDLIYNKIRKIDGIISVEMSLIMGYHKRRYDYGTAAG